MEKVPSTERVKIRPTNVRLETTVHQKEETFQVIIDVIKNSTCFMAFTIFTDVSEIFMHQFWYTIKKVKDTESYEFLLANKKCLVDAEVFRKILDICPRVKGEEFTELQDDDATLTYLIDLGYKGPLHKHTSMYVDHMHQPWRTLTTIINKCLSRKTASNDRLRKSRIDILWGMFYRENVNYPELIWEDFAFQIDHKKEKVHRGRKLQILLQVHATHARIMTESVLEPARRRPSGITFRDTPRVLNKVSSDPSQKLKGVQSLTPEEQETADTIKALKESKKTSRRQSGIGGSSEGTGVSPRVPDESIVWGSEQESKYSKEDKRDDDETIEWVDTDEEEEKKDDDDDKSIDLEKTDTKETDDEFMHSGEYVQTDDEETDDEFVHGDEPVNDDEDEEMTNAEVEESGNGNEENTNAAKTDAGKTEEVEDDAKKTELPPTSSSLSVSLGFGDQFLKLSSNTSLIGTFKDTTDAEINSLLDIKIQSEVPHILFPFVLTISVLVISEPSILTSTPETPSLRVAKLEKDVSELKKINHYAEALATLKSQVPTAFEHYLGSKISDDLQKVLQRYTADLIQKYSVKPAPKSSKIQKPTSDLEQEYENSASEIRKVKKEQAEKKKMPKYTIKSTDKAALKEYDQKSALYQAMHKNKSFNRNPANHALYHALIEALIEDENTMDKGVADTIKNHKRQHNDDDDKDPSAGPNQGKKTKRRRTKESESSKKPSTTKETFKGKSLSKSSKTGKSATTKEPVEEPIAEVIIDDAVNTASKDVVHDDDQPQDTSEPKTYKTQNQDWFKQPSRPPTLDPEWNKHQVVLDQPEQPWFNQMVFNTKDPPTFNDLMSTQIDFSKSQVNKFSKHNVYSTQKILGVKSVSVKKLHGYGHLEEIMVKRADRQLHKFKEGDFVDLNLNEIEDMLLLAVQHKLFHLNGSDIVEFIVALRMFTRSLIIKRHVEDLQLRVESYQKKLNITAPQKTFP
ncbi:hypothetical protein Tco_0448913 [Tanacetum coccineum]